MKHEIRLTINGDNYTLAIDPRRTLNQVLREELNLIGTKLGCGSGDCGACTVIMDGLPVNSCLVLAVEAHGAQIETYNDHRIAMSFAVAGLAVHGITVLGEDCVVKSFPDFWDRFQGLYG